MTDETLSCQDCDIPLGMLSIGPKHLRLGHVREPHPIHPPRPMLNARLASAARNAVPAATGQPKVSGSSQSANGTRPARDGRPRTAGPSGVTSSSLWAHIDRSSGPDACWPWTGARTTKGYGRVGLGGGRYAHAHRIVLGLALGHPLVPSEDACHRCDNPPCCNPAHLFAGSRAENMRDMAAKGRSNNQPRAHCQRGHDLAVHGRRDTDGHRRCRECHRLGQQHRSSSLQSRRRARTPSAVGTGSQSVAASSALGARRPDTAGGG